MALRSPRLLPGVWGVGSTALPPTPPALTQPMPLRRHAQQAHCPGACERHAPAGYLRPMRRAWLIVVVAALLLGWRARTPARGTWW